MEYYKNEIINLQSLFYKAFEHSKRGPFSCILHLVYKQIIYDFKCI